LKWCFDTSALIEPWVRRYPPDIFGPVWEKLEALCSDRVIAAPVDVRLELEKQSDNLYKWAKTLDGFFIDSDRALLERSKEIINRFPGLIKPNSTKSAADPFVIAMAEIHAVPVVTYETAAKQNQAPKIPNVCAARGIQVVSLVDVLRAEGFRM
jgi:hypothetical protein